MGRLEIEGRTAMVALLEQGHSQSVNGGDKADHSVVQIQVIGRASSGKTRALTR